MSRNISRKEKSPLHLGNPAFMTCELHNLHCPLLFFPGHVSSSISLQMQHGNRIPLSEQVISWSWFATSISQETIKCSSSSICSLCYAYGKILRALCLFMNSPDTPNALPHMYSVGFSEASWKALPHFMVKFHRHLNVHKLLAICSGLQNGLSHWRSLKSTARILLRGGGIAAT